MSGGVARVCVANLCIVEVITSPARLDSGGPPKMKSSRRFRYVRRRVIARHNSVPCALCVCMLNILLTRKTLKSCKPTGEFRPTGLLRKGNTVQTPECIC